MKHKPLVYVAGPYRARDYWQIAENIRSAEQTALWLAKTFDVIPVIPHTMYQNFDGALSDEFLLEATLRLMEQCAGVVFCKGWENSQGSQGEHKRAEELHLEIFYDTKFGREEIVSEMMAWLRSLCESCGTVLGHSDDEKRVCRFCTEYLAAPNTVAVGGEG